MQDTIERIQRMESNFDTLQKALTDDPDAFLDDISIKEILRELIQYYEGGQWLRDYELDEKGLLPKDLKRGVLAQDAVYDFLEAIPCQR